MAYAPVRLAHAALTTTLTTNLATVSGGATGAIVKEVVIANTNATATAVTITAAGVVIVPALSCAANSVTVLDLSVVLANTETILGGASATGVNVSIHGVSY